MNNQLTTKNITAPTETLEALQRDFSHCFDKAGNFDIEKFKREISGAEVNFSKESYSMDWLGKSYARVRATDPATTLLKEDVVWNSKKENKNSENILVKGDNLEVLKHLSNAYHEQVKMIYIDPPYNTGTDGFVYEDDRKFLPDEFAELAGVDLEQAKRILEFVDSKSNSHSAWLSFMYPRLYIARQLLQDDGIIFVSIDDNEVAQLRILMDEIFGPDKFIGQFNWVKTETPSNLSEKIKNTIEYILCYQKQNTKKIAFSGIIKDAVSSNPLLNQSNKISVLKFSEIHTDTGIINGSFKKGIYGTSKYKVDLLEDVEVKNGVFVSPILLKGKFRWTQEYLDEQIKNGVKISIRTKQFVPSYEKADYGKEIPSNLINFEVGAGTNEQASSELDVLMGGKYFSYPKPVSLIQYLINMVSKDGDIILDFFAGSGTTGNAVFQANSEDITNRKFILVQLKEKIDATKNKLAYDFVKKQLKITEPTICDLTEERLIRSAKKIKDKQKESTHFSDTDLGFKVFELIPLWEGYGSEPEEYSTTVKMFNVDKLSEDNLQTLLTTWKTYDSIPLTTPLSIVDLAGYLGYYGNGKLYLMKPGFTVNHLATLLKKIDTDTTFCPATIILFGYHFESARMREIAENVKSYANKKSIDIECITRY